MSLIKKYLGVIALLGFFSIPQGLDAQSVAVGSILDEQVQLQTLLVDSLTLSPVNRPYSGKVYSQLIGSIPQTGATPWWQRNLLNKRFSFNNIAEIGMMPTVVSNTYNSRFPYGENNGAAWYGRGSNLEFMGGFYIKSEFVTVNIYPHIIYTENLDFLTPRFIPRDKQGNIRYVAEGIHTALDAPFRFGPDSYNTISPGNSSIRLHYKNFETGLSTEPLWWGPAQQYPLLFSNNAPGIPHFFIGSREPVTIPYAGRLQFKWMMGYPEESKYFDGPSQGVTRFTNALNLAYNPSFLKNLTVGISRIYHMIEVDGFSLENVTLIFKPGVQQDFVPIGQGDITQDRNQAISFYAHLLLPKARAEVYGEFFREDRSYNIRDFGNQPHHNSAYLFGFQKISDLPGIDFLKTKLEFTNLTSSQLNQVRPQNYVYTHSKIRQGHTNQGQILGAAIGPGSNSQFLSFDAYKGNYKFGIFAQRWVDNDNFHFDRGSRSISPSREFGDYFRHRVNLNLGLNFLYGPGPFYLNGKLMWTKAYNYGRFDYGEFTGVTIRNYEHKDLVNIQFQIGLTYIF